MCVHFLVAEHPMTVCCQYDARRFDGATIMIVRGQLVRNPYFVDPEIFLQRYSQPAAGPAS